MARAGLVLFGLVTAAVLLLVFDIVLGIGAGLIAAALAVACFALLWYGVPRWVEHRTPGS